MPKLMIDGVWRGDVAGEVCPEAETFRIGASAGAGPRRPAEPGRYHLFISYACPFAHRTMLVRALKALEHAIAVSVLHPRWNTTEGWIFADTEYSTRDLSGAGFTHLHQAYSASRPGYTGRVTVPVLWDTKTQRIASNDSRDIVALLDTTFDSDARPLAPPQDDASRTLGDQIANNIAFGVYRIGGARDQTAYDMAANALFGQLDVLSDRLRDGRAFLHGATPTIDDIILFPPLVRFDAIYNPLFRASRKGIAEYPELSQWLRRFWALPGVAATVRFDHILRHYHDGDWGVANRRDIVPDLPLALVQPAQGAHTGQTPLRYV